MDWLDAPALWWLAAAALLAAIELVVPGVFLVFLAFAAAVTGVFSLLFPDLPLWGQAISFAAWAGVAVAVGGRWYRDFGPASADPLLNDRAARLLGDVVTVTVAIEGGRGRVRVGDSEWPAAGPDLPSGARARIIAAQNGVLTIEPILIAE
ncbi:NfeD family protein [Sphingomonas baiyangensis]|uniref:NfeD family protein n=1 Tax=Sphingomonas baiyangensis TaxID=2572576 RepID=A0A4U1L217_9SPHN|nr:NfeD family protein [Sphingomonas baiyangensis]TKD50879.1 NfeD family protein [Sphingomonas baiyangensis]